MGRKKAKAGEDRFGYGLQVRAVFGRAFGFEIKERKYLQAVVLADSFDCGFVFPFSV